MQGIRSAATMLLLYNWRLPTPPQLLLTPVKRITKYRDFENSQKELFNKLLLNMFCIH